MDKEIMQLKMPFASKELIQAINWCSIRKLFSFVHSADKPTKNMTSINFNFLFCNLCSGNLFKSGVEY